MIFMPQLDDDVIPSRMLNTCIMVQKKNFRLDASSVVSLRAFSLQLSGVKKIPANTLFMPSFSPYNLMSVSMYSVRRSNLKSHANLS